MGDGSGDAGAGVAATAAAAAFFAGPPAPAAALGFVDAGLGGIVSHTGRFQRRSFCGVT
jgi:hypothetical protein